MKVKKTDIVGFAVDATEHCVCVRESDPTAEWDGDDTESSWSINKVSIVDQYPDVTACFEVSPDDVLYLVYLVYSTGDSFSTHTDDSITFIDIFKTETNAVNCAKTIRKHYEYHEMLNSFEVRRLSITKQRELAKKFNSYSVDYIRENGETVSLHASWTGYFDRLSYVEIHPFTVGALGHRRF